MMKHYHVILSILAKDQIKAILHYATFVNSSSDYTKKLREKLYESFSSLSQFPYRFPIVQEKELQKYGVRKYTIHSFMILYAVDETCNTVHIISVTSSKRNMKEVSKSIQYTLEGIFGKDFFVNEPKVIYYF